MSVKLEIQDFVRVLRPATKADALRMTMNLSLHERSELANATEKGSTTGQKRKAEQHPANITFRDSSSSGTFRHHQQEAIKTEGYHGGVAYL